MLSEYTKKKKKKSKVGCDNKQARDSKKKRKNSYLNFSFKLEKKNHLKGQYETTSSHYVKDLKLSFIWTSTDN